MNLFDAKAWGIEFNIPYDSPPPMPPASPAPPMIAPDDRWRTVAGPVAVLGAFVFSMTLNATCGRDIGGVACAWRPSFSPDSRAFGIWTAIYIGMIVTLIIQALDGFGPVLYAADTETNSLIAFAWLMCGLWVIVFSNADSHDRRIALGLAACILVLATWAALRAVLIEASWRSDDYVRIFCVGVPYSLFAGWLCVASTLGISIFLKSLFYPPDLICYQRQDAYSTRVTADPTDQTSWHSAVPLMVATAISLLSFVIPDPVLPLPTAWGVFWMRGHFKNWLAIKLLVMTSVASVIASRLDVFIF